MYRYGLQLITALLHPAGLSENCRGCATQSLQFFKDLKSKTTLQRADPASIRIVIHKILQLGQVRHTAEYFVTFYYLLYQQLPGPLFTIQYINNSLSLADTAAADNYYEINAKNILLL